MPDFTLYSLKDIVGAQYITDAWISEQQERGKKVAIYRDYYDGKQDANLTIEMRNMLRKSSSGEELTINYCQHVVDTMIDRLVVERIEADNEAATKWADNLRRDIRFDELQIDIHEGAGVDGQTFLMVWVDDDNNLTFEHEPAWDGTEGMLVVYDRRGRDILVAIKVWYENDMQGNDITRVNVYTPTEIRKYDDRSGGLKLIEGEGIENPIVNPVGQIPVRPFTNRGTRRLPNGISELKSVAGLQDSVNRIAISLLITSELSAFPIMKVKGFPPPNIITPGMIVEIQPSDKATTVDEAAKMLEVMNLEQTEQSSAVPFIEAARFYIDSISTTTRTPMPENMGSSVQSGEALKQREIGLLGKLRRFQVKIGNAWEDAMLLAQDVAQAFKVQGVPQAKRWDTKWMEIELRNDREVVENALKASDKFGDKEFLRQTSGVFNLDEAAIERIMQEKADQLSNFLAATPSQTFDDEVEPETELVAA